MSTVTNGLPIWRRELSYVLEQLERKNPSRVLVLGSGGSGKTTLMFMLRDELRRQGRSAFFVSVGGMSRPGELGGRVLDAVTEFAPVEIIRGRMLRSSTGSLPVSEVVRVLREADDRLTQPILILDALDGASDPMGTASALEELSRALGDWQVVVSSRPNAAALRLSRFDRIDVSGLSSDEATALLRELTPEANETQIAEAVAATYRLQSELRLLAHFGPRDLPSGPAGSRPRDPVDRFVASLIDNTPDAASVQVLLERLALMGGRERLTDLATWLGLPLEVVFSLTNNSRLMEVEGGNDRNSVVVLHPIIRSIVVARRLREAPFRPIDLRFGAEDAERDDLLDESFVPRQNLESILGSGRSIVVGDRGSGKSAIFRKLSARSNEMGLFPVANVGDLFQRIAGPQAQDADTLRAAWLVLVSAVAAAAAPESAPKKLRREAAELRAAVGLPTPPVGRVQKALRWTARLFGGTTLKFAVGPVNLEAQLPGDGRPSTATVDVESFLQDLDGLLQATDRRAVVLFDRIDELFKYDRVRQEAVIQGLLGAEGRITLLNSITLVVFLRTDLFELYDIQEKNKLVSRRLMLEWSEQDWLQVLVRRMLANEPLAWVANRLRLPEGGFETRAALGVLFPPEVEGRPIDRWLVDSVRNGNGDMSPRLAVLLLYLARDHSAQQSEPVDELPVFTADAVTRAMTEVSELSFSEVVNDFKVATSFVLNCRAAKRTTFTLAEVEKLFQRDEGPISEQVRLLERLGFLERVVVETDAGAESRFRIPELYTRCWEHI